MDSLPRGANFQRIKMLWEIGLHVAADPAARQTGNRDMFIAIGNGSREKFRPSLRMATGSPLLAYDVARGELDLAIMNPSALLTQAYRGTGIFSEPLPVRVIANYPSWDRFVCAIHPRTGLTSLGQIRERRYPLQLSIRQDPGHATRMLIDQILPAYDFTLRDIESWGGSLHFTSAPGEKERIAGIQNGTIDAVFDEGIGSWFPPALEAGLQPIALEEPVVTRLEASGWRRVLIPKDRFPALKSDHPCLDFGGWPLYTHASLPDEQAYQICAALQTREAFILYWLRPVGAGYGRDTARCAAASGRRPLVSRAGVQRVNRFWILDYGSSRFGTLRHAQGERNLVILVLERLFNEPAFVVSNPKSKIQNQKGENQNAKSG